MNSSDESTANPPPEGAPDPLGDEDLKVLLVEDNPGDARLFEEYLEESPVEATLCHERTLEMGLETFRKDRPHVLVLDLGLPDSEGAETVEAAVGAAPELPIVVLTGQDDLGAALEAQEAGAAQYLQKTDLNPTLLGRTLRWTIQRHRMQAKLRQRDAWIRSITEGLSAGVFRCGPTGRIEYANEALADLLGAESSEELIGRDLTEFYADPVQKGQMLVEEGAEGMEIEFRQPDESSIVGLLSTRPAYDADGTPIHYDGTITDITERKKRERRLRMLSEAVEQAKESVIITEAAPLDRPGPRIEYVNAAFEDMTGYSEEEILGETPRVLQGEETDREALDSLREALEAREEWQGETVNYRKDGESYRVQWNVAPVRGEDGSIEHWVSVQRDVTEERRRERKRAQMAQALEQIGDKVIITDQEGQIQYVNRAFEDITGYREADVLGKNMRILQSGEQSEAFYEKLWDTIRSGDTFQAEFVNVRKDGTRYVEDQRISPITGEEGEVTRFVSAGRDMTERKEAERELQRSRERYRSLFEDSNDAILVHDLEGQIQEANPRAEALFGQETGALKGRSVHDLHPPETRDTASEKLEALRGGTDYEATTRYERAGGPMFWGEVSASTTEIGGKTVVRSLIRDVTERERGRRELERYREYTDRLLDAIDDLFFVLDEEGRLQRWNDSVPEVTGYSEEEIGGMSAFDLVPGGDHERVAEQIEKGFTEGHAQIEVPLLREDGSAVPYEFVGNLVKHPEGGVRAVGIGRDITERRRRKRRLERQNDLFERAQEIADVGAWEYDAEAGEFTLTGQGRRIHGFATDSDVTPGRSHELFHPEDRSKADEAFRRAVEEGDPYDIEARLTTEEGEKRWIRSRGEPQRGTGGEVARVRGAIQDITERKEREETLKEAKEKAERMNRLKSAFLANMSHEIRTPLTSILGFAEAIGEEVRGTSSPEEIDTPMLSEFSDLIEKSGQRLMETLTSVLNLSKLEAGEMALSTGQVDLAPEAEETVGELRPQASKAGIDLHVDLDSPVWAEVDKGGLHMVLRNLLSNAIKYTREGGQVWVRARAEENLSVLEVEDTGIGMDPAETAELFEAFKQESEGTDREYEGTGLGLTLVKEILDRMDGSIKVETEKGEGSRFTVRLPRATGGS